MLAQFLRSLFRFRKTTVSVLLVATYVVVFLLNVWDRIRYQYSLPEDNKHHKQLLDASWIDLQSITRKPHPYTSRENDAVHDFLLHRVTELVEGAPYAEVSDDYKEGNHLVFKQPDVFNSSSTESRIVSFESSNIVVKITGSQPELPGLLVSAHFDSVPTALGATDDGVGIVTLLALITRYAKKQPRRTLVFNLNNNEEFGLLGASAFLNHPWRPLVDYVLNLEGTGAGGKAVLFRTSDTNTASIYKNAVKTQPFGNSIYQQAFYDRYISSETDYKVYEQAGLRGWDIAFYKPRALYHTIKDSTQFTSQASLWNMMHASLQLADFIAFESFEDEPEDRSPAVYFDIIGTFFVTASTKDLFTLNCVVLSVIPVIILVLEFVIQRRKTRERNPLLVWLRLPFSMFISYLVTATFRSSLFRVNPLIFSRDYVSPTIGFSFTFLILNYLVLSLLEYLAPSRDLKTVSFVELFFGMWIALLWATIRLCTSKYTATGVYPITVLYLLMSFGAIVGLVCSAFKRKHSVVKAKDSEETAAPNTYSSIEESPQQATNTEAPNENSPEEHDERAPLLRASNSSQVSSVTNVSEAPSSALKTFVVSALNYDWSVQFLAVVPLASFFVIMCLSLILDGIYQTCQEGFQATWNVSKISMLGGMLLAIPVLPFCYKLNYFVSMVLLFAAASAGIFSFERAPFTESSPLKLRFSQELNLHDELGLSTVNVFGRQGAGIEQILRNIPSTQNAHSNVECTSNGQGSETCRYAGPRPHLVSSSSIPELSDVLSIKVLSNNRKSSGRSSYEPINAELVINVKENRLCTIGFNSSQSAEHAYGQSPVKQVTIFGNAHHDNRTRSQLSTLDGLSRDDEGNRIFKWNRGINSLQLHKLDFERNYYHVGIQWMPTILSQDADEESSDALGLKIRCFWGEYDSVSIINGEVKRKVPALDELLAYSPKEVSFSNREAGLVIVNDYIEL
ncbi:Vacuolar membrane protease [Lachancea thermotolerans]